MKPIAREWIAKAEADFATAERELAVQVDANYDAVCFHAQQCAEKYLKAHLQEHDVPFRRTHDLSDLLDSAVTITPNWEPLREDLNALTLFAVEYRYLAKPLIGQTRRKRLKGAVKFVKQSVQNSRCSRREKWKSACKS